MPLLIAGVDTQSHLNCTTTMSQYIVAHKLEWERVVDAVDTVTETAAETKDEALLGDPHELKERLNHVEKTNKLKKHEVKVKNNNDN